MRWCRPQYRWINVYVSFVHDVVEAG